MSGVKMSPAKTWAIANQEYLMSAIARVRSYLQLHIQRLNPEAEFDTTALFSLPEQAIPWDLETPSSLDELSQRFGLSSFERDILVLCAGMELDGTWGTLCATAQGEAQAQYPTFNLALEVLPSPNWMALTPVGALRRWRLLDIGVGNALTQSPLRIDERVLHYLVGIEHPEERLSAIITRIPIQVGEMDRLCGS
ncbi:MAG TPA: hypothetical protein V6D27_17430, partial [Vampirovibrionales bacterium]